MIPKTMPVAMVCCCLFATGADAQSRRDPWRKDPFFQRLAATLDRVPAIDTHTHLLQRGAFDPKRANAGPLMLRASQPWFVAAVRGRFNVSIQPDRLTEADAAIVAARTRMIERLGMHGYWMDHLDYTLTDIALVNQSARDGTDGKRLRWVPYASTLLYPLPAGHLMERSPAHREDIAEIQKELNGLLKDAGLREPSGDLAGYLRFVDAMLRRWQGEGAVAVKFTDAYLRTLRIADVDQERAATLYAKGRGTPLPRDEYLTVQDYLWRHILLEAGTLKLPVHIHSSLGVPPFLRTLESDVRNLEDVLADSRFFGTAVVLIHGGGPWYDIASYFALKPNVWVDISAMAFVFPVPEVAGVLRSMLVRAPERVLYGTDAASYPSVPGGADAQHLMLSRTTRDALYVALSGLVRDGVIDEPRALELGRGVLRDNARRLYGWQ
jgi:predicted TIM-barrel fold metal-dependent hydrolase